MKWITNAPKHPSVTNIHGDGTLTPTQNLQNHLKFREGLVVGPPQPTPTTTVALLEGMGLVGLYDPKLEEDNPTHRMEDSK